MMNGDIDYAALPIVCELIGLEDPAELVDDLLVIREHLRRKAHA